MSPGHDTIDRAPVKGGVLKATLRGWSAERDEDVIAALAEGFTQAEIAAGLRVSRSRVSKIIARLRLHRRLPASAVRVGQ